MSTGLELGPGTLLDEDCKIVDKNGTVYTSAVITIDIDRLELRIVCPGSVTASKAVPDLPRRCFLTKSELIIQSSVVIPTTYYEIFVQTTQGNWTIPFSITAKECQYGANTYVFADSRMRVTLSYNGTVYVKGGSPIAFCIPHLPYHYVLGCPFQSPYSDCSVTVYHSPSTFLFSEQLTSGSTAEGDFETVETHAPIISFPSIVALPRRARDKISVRYTGVVRNVTIQADGEPAFAIDGVNYDLRIIQPRVRLVTHTITASNNKGSTSFTFKAGFETCPDGMDFFCFSRNGERSIEYYKATGPEGQVSCSHPDNNVPCICSRGDDISLHMWGVDDNGWRRTTPLLMRDNTDYAMNYYLPAYKSQDTRHVHYHAIVSPNDSLRFFKGKEPAGWNTNNFKDSTWSEGTGDVWGNYPDTQSVFFRKSVKAVSTKGVSIVSVTVRVNGDCEMFVNGEKVARVLTNVTVTHRKFLPVSLFSKKSVIAVSLKQTNESVIVFDMSLHTTSSMCMVQSINGIASSNDTSPVGGYGPDLAFALDSYDSWKTSTTPVTLEYSFAHGDMAIVNEIVIPNTKDVIPKSFVFEGLVDNEVVRLYSHDSEYFMSYGSEQVIRFNNNRFFTSYRFVFIENRSEGGKKELLLSKVRLMLCESVLCKKWLMPTSEAGAVLYKKCPMGSSGVRAYRCDDVDGVGKWLDDRSACLSSVPRQGISFVDWSFELKYLYYKDWSDVEKSVVEMIMKNITVYENEIEFVMVRDMSGDEMAITQVEVRFVVDKMIGDYIGYHVGKWRDSFGDAVKRSLGDKYEGSIVGSIKLREPINYVMICVVSVVVIAFALMSLALYRSRLANGKTSKRSLKRSGKENKESDVNSSLLIALACCVCFDRNCL